MSSNKAVKLVELKKNIQVYQTVKKFMKDEKLAEQDYRFELEILDDDVVKIHCWHKDLLDKQGKGSTIGDPSGKCRTIEYSKKQNKILKSYYWR